MQPVDSNGQPALWLNRPRRQQRDSSERLGVIRGVLADGHASDDEVIFMAKWLYTNQEFASQWPFDILANRLVQVLEDNVIDEEERQDLKQIMVNIVGEESPSIFANAPTTVPLTLPEPEVIFDPNEFVLTGAFAYGKRSDCEKEIQSRGGRCGRNVTLRTNYLVIGALGSRDWINTAWGRKIQRAAEYARSRSSIYIINEKRWVDFLLPCINQERH